MNKEHDSVNGVLRRLRDQDWPGSSHNPELEESLMQAHERQVSRKRNKLSVITAALAVVLLGGVGFAAAGGIELVKTWFITAEVDGREVIVDSADITVEQDDETAVVTVENIELSAKPGDPPLEEGGMVTITVTNQPEED